MTRNRRRREPRGMVLIVVLVVIVLLSLAAYAFADRMLAEQKAARLHAARVQSRLAAESGAEYVARSLSQAAASADALSVDRSDNAANFRAMRLLPRESFDADDTTPTPRFTVIAPPLEDDEADIRYGLVDESAKLNLLALAAWDAAEPGVGRRALLTLPDMTPSIADRILDYVDGDTDPREQGFEAEAVGRPTLEGLLSIEGITPELLFGADRDRNGRVDAAETMAPEGATPESGAANKLPPGGWATWLTLASAESPLTPAGEPRIDLNSPNLAELHVALVKRFDEPTADFIVAWRQFGPTTEAAPGKPEGKASSAAATAPRRRTPRLSESRGSMASGSQESRTSPKSESSKKSTKPDAKSKKAKVPTIPVEVDPAAATATMTLGSAYDLLGAQVNVPGTAQRAARVLTSPWKTDDVTGDDTQFARLLDETSTQATPRIGRVNLLQAPRAVLAAIPGIEPRTVDALLEARGQGANLRSDRRTLLWLVRDKHLSLADLKRLAPRLTTGGSVASAQVVGFVDPAGPVERYELVVDATVRPPRQLSWKSLAHWGRGYPPAVLDPLTAPTAPSPSAASSPSLASAP